MENEWITRSKYYVYYYFGDGRICTSSSTKNRPKDQENSAWKWKKNDILTIKVNLNKWNITYFINNKQIGTKVNIIPNQKYHPVICSQYHEAEYKLLR